MLTFVWGYRTTVASACALVATVFILLVAPASHAAGKQETGGLATLNGCQDSYAPIPASAADTRTYAPEVDQARYRIYGEQVGAAILVVRIFACESVKVRGSRPRPTLGAQFGVTLESPDGTGRVYGSDACCNWYTFFWVTDNRAFAKWLKDGTALGGVVRYVKRGRLVYRRKPTEGSGTTAVYFAAKPPTPSPFELEATVLPVPLLAMDILPNWWAQTERGSIKIANRVPGFRAYEASGEVRARAGTRMAALFRGERKSFGSPFSYGRWNRSVTTKEVLPAARASAR